MEAAILVRNIFRLIVLIVANRELRIIVVNQNGENKLQGVAPTTAKPQPWLNPLYSE